MQPAPAASNSNAVLVRTSCRARIDLIFSGVVKARWSLLS
jgi:hypothetical protein